MMDMVICPLSGYGLKIQYEHGDGCGYHPHGTKLDVTGMDIDVTNVSNMCVSDKIQMAWM